MAHNSFLEFIPGSTITRFFNGKVWVYEIYTDEQNYIGASVLPDFDLAIVINRVAGKAVEQIKYLEELVLDDVS